MMAVLMEVLVMEVLGEPVGDPVKFIPFILIVFAAFIIVVLILGLRYGNF